MIFWGRATSFPFSTKFRESKWQRGRATQFPFSPKFRESKWQRGRATPFPFSPKIRESVLLLWGLEKWQRGCATSFPFSLKIRESALFLAEVEPHPRRKRNPMCVFVTKRHPTWRHASKNASETRATREKHASDPASDCTAPRPFSPSIVRLAYDPWCCHGMIKSMILRVEFELNLVSLIWYFDLLWYYLFS